MPEQPLAMTKLQDELKAAIQNIIYEAGSYGNISTQTNQRLESLILRAVDTADPEYIKQLEAGCEERDKYKKALELCCAEESNMTPQYWIEEAQEGK